MGNSTTRITLTVIATAMLLAAACSSGPATDSMPPSTGWPATTTYPAGTLPSSTDDVTFETLSLGDGTCLTCDNTAPITIAMRPGVPGLDPEGFPERLLTLAESLAEGPDTIITVILSGPQPNTGYTVRVTGVDRDARGGLAVRYEIAAPEPGTDSESTTSHPWTIVSLNEPRVSPDNVTFVAE